MIGRFLWPLHIPIFAKSTLAVLMLIASQYHLWSRLSSGSVFSPEFPRPVVILFNWALGAILLLAVFQLALDSGTLMMMLIRRDAVFMPDNVRYALAIVAAVLAAIGVHQAVRVPPVKDVEIGIPRLPPAFDGYKMLQLRASVVARSISPGRMVSSVSTSAKWVISTLSRSGATTLASQAAW